nr:reverse transcriptase domain-containing protein [Tanacetum cinerariifolium]
ESVWTSTARVILFDTIPTTIPSTTPIVDLPVIHDDTLWIPTILPIVPTILPIAPTIQYTFPFISTNSSGSDTSERPPSQDPYEVTVARWRSRVATSSDSYLDSSSYSSSRHSSSGYALSYSPCDSKTATSVRPSHKRCRSPTSLVLVALPVRESLSHVHVDLLSPPKRIKDSDSVIDFEADIDECFTYIDAIRARGTDVRVVVETAADEERDHGHRIMATSQQSDTMSERIGTLERDNRRLRGMLDVERHKVDRIWRSMSYVQRDFREIRRFCFYDRVRIGRLEAYAMRHWDIALIFLFYHYNVEANGDNGNGNGNRNGNPNVNNRGVVPVARECTYQDFVKCQPLNFKGTKGVIGLTRWFEKIEIVFHISNCPPRRGYARVLSYCNKCIMHHEGSYMAKCGNKTGNNKAKARVYAIRGGGANPDSNIVTGLLGLPFDIDLMCVELGSFKVIGCMDWFVKYHAVMVCDKKIICIPYGDYVLIIEGDGCNRGSRLKLSIISCTKTQKYILKGCQVYLAQVTAN